MHASYGKYVAAIANSIADSASPAGTPAIFAWAYRGPGINTSAGSPLVVSDEALRRVFDWFDAGGGTSRPPFFTSIPGVQTQIRQSLISPHAKEFAFRTDTMVRTDVSLNYEYPLGTRSRLFGQIQVLNLFNQGFGSERTADLRRGGSRTAPASPSQETYRFVSRPR